MPPIDSEELEEMWRKGETHVDSNVDLPSSLDWREKGWVTQVYTQEAVCVVISSPDPYILTTHSIFQTVLVSYV